MLRSSFGRDLAATPGPAAALAGASSSLSPPSSSSAHVGSIEALPRRMLRHVAMANHLARRRTFELADARASLSGRPDELDMWDRCVRAGVIPLVKVLASDGDRSGEFQFKHLSFQEALFVEALMAGARPPRHR